MRQPFCHIRERLFVGNVDVGGGDDVGILGNELNVALDRIANSAKEVKQSLNDLVIKVLKVDYNRASLNKVVCNCDNIVEVLGIDDFKLQVA